MRERSLTGMRRELSQAACGGRDHVLEREQRQRRGEAVQARAAREQPAAPDDRVRRAAGLGEQVERVLAREPAQVGGVEDALGLARPAAAGEVRVRAPVVDVREADDDGRARLQSAARSGRASPTGRSGARARRRRSACRRCPRSAAAAPRRRRSRGPAGVAASRAYSGSISMPVTCAGWRGLERRAGGAGRAAEVEHAAGRRRARGRGSRAAPARRPRRGPLALLDASAAGYG